IALKPDFAEAHNNLGNTLRELGKLEEAEQHCRKAIAINPNAAEVYVNLALVMQESGKLVEAEFNYRQAIQLRPDFAEVHNNLGSVLQDLHKIEEAVISYRNATKLAPSFAIAHYNLANALQELGDYQPSMDSYLEAIRLRPDYADAHSNAGAICQEQGKLGEAEEWCRRAVFYCCKPNLAEASLDSDLAGAYNNLGMVLRAKGDLDQSVSLFKRAIMIEPESHQAHSNLGAVLRDLGMLEESVDSLRKAVDIKPDLAIAHNNLGNTFMSLAKVMQARQSYERALYFQPEFADVIWNLVAVQNGIEGAKLLLERCLSVNPNHLDARCLSAAVFYYEGDQEPFRTLLKSEFEGHPFVRTLEWVFNLPNLPKLYFNQWRFYDAVFENSIKSRPFYEFGVWRGHSFNYLINLYKRGYGFDTFEGLPSDWRLGSLNEKKGSYSARGSVPQIQGGQFIKGPFEQTLPEFFTHERPLAALINFDADLYSSTICALNFSKRVIDQDTVLIFDELIINEDWENHEYKALNEFCASQGLTYDVVALSLTTKQVAVKLRNLAQGVGS
ncbi:MAG: hypothetical protein CMF52_08460, partial [Legionellales bacterium]|nr:hypothetical protein [Legionellales bacterium]